MRSRPFQRKSQCDYCGARPVIWAWRRSRLWPSGRMMRSNAAACANHEDCVNFRSMVAISESTERADV